MSPRTGRPKLDNPKSVKYSIRLDVSTELKLRQFCQRYGLTRGEAIRIAITRLLEVRR